MDPFGLSATGLVVWGIVAHLVADWPLQNEWMATNKTKRARKITKPFRLRWGRTRRVEIEGELVWPGTWVAYVLWRHPAAYVHAGIHGLFLAPVFGWPAAVIAAVYLVIDTRAPLALWARFYRQTMPAGRVAVEAWAADPENRPYDMDFDNVAIKTRFRVPASSMVADYTEQRIRDLQDELGRLKRDMTRWTTPVYDMGTEVRLWTDQVAHIAVIAIAALVVTL